MSRIHMTIGLFSTSIFYYLSVIGRPLHFSPSHSRVSPKKWMGFEEPLKGTKVQHTLRAHLYVHLFPPVPVFATVLSSILLFPSSEGF